MTRALTRLRPCLWHCGVKRCTRRKATACRKDCSRWAGRRGPGPTGSRKESGNPRALRLRRRDIQTPSQSSITMKGRPSCAGRMPRRHRLPKLHPTQNRHPPRRRRQNLRLLRTPLLRLPQKRRSLRLRPRRKIRKKRQVLPTTPIRTAPSCIAARRKLWVPHGPLPRLKLAPRPDRLRLRRRRATRNRRTRKRLS